jgi:hypothetical protein
MGQGDEHATYIVLFESSMRNTGGSSEDAKSSGEVVDVLPGMNAGASTHAVPSPIEGSGTAWVLLGSWALSPARPTPIHPRRERRGLPALLVSWGS